jgi:hypothetical protein
LLVVPGLNLIMVRNGETLAPGPDEPPVRDDDVFTKYHDYRARILFEPLVEAVTNASRASRGEEAHAAKSEARNPKSEMNPSLLTPAPTNNLPRSSFLQEIRWAPVETIRRAARGSDNWPLAWADDDSLYGAFGDGNGFEPFIAEKLSLGFARITGGPSDFAGMNLRSPTGETRGNGPAGRKASGLLCVDGTLYLWTRNATNSQLAWSGDHGATWTWAGWRFTESFGCPAFLDFGRNYAEARDDFVYVHSPDANSAYEIADRLVLARALKTRLRDRDAYEFFAGLDGAGQPQWSRNLAHRRAVFTPGTGCYRSRVTYNAALRRYLLVQPVPGLSSRDKAGQLDTRSHGGLAIYDAPEPWGPWTSVFFTARWDVGPGDSASFPSKWMNPNGTTLHLVFSGDDSFSVRQATLVPARMTSRSPARPQDARR